MALTSSAFWFALGSIILTNIVLSGDNAVVIALAARNLPRRQQRQAIFWGSAAAIALRIVLTALAVKLLALPYLKTIGAVLLVYIGIKLLSDAEDEAAGDHRRRDGLWPAIQTILVADLVMSLDNVVAVAAAAEKGPPGTAFALLVLGLGLSIPLIVFGSTLLVALMVRFPAIVMLAAALLGYLAGDMLVTDPVDAGWFAQAIPYADVAAGCLGALIVVIVGWWISRRSLRQA
ncbi:YjbE family putative metal transport protein [Ralstonia syzygii]|uniref:YjbE family putative metal transport protein n=1 Tax=Ralstonia syzygii TaxID=28097 RepID=A0ABX7ZHI9_9RALS|nr:TerC family protein [Ralstonia syzygii]QUP54856.1 YjbE family putative metal transport protein [Ralstonia syzygii]